APPSAAASCLDEERRQCAGRVNREPRDAGSNLSAASPGCERRRREPRGASAGRRRRGVVVVPAGALAAFLADCRSERPAKARSVALAARWGGRAAWGSSPPGTPPWGCWGPSRARAYRVLAVTAARGLGTR